MKSNYLIVAIISLALAIGIFAFVYSSPTIIGKFAQIPEEKSKPVKIATDKLVGGLPLFVALDQNFLENKGIAYEKDTFATASIVAQSLLAEKHEVGGPISLLDIFIIESKNPGQLKVFSVFAETSSSPISHIIVKKDSPLESIKDLKGKKVAIGPGALPEFLAKTLFKKFAVENVNLVTIAPNLWLQSLEQGQVEAVYSIEPFTTIAVEKGIGRVILEGAESKVIDPMPVVGVAFTSKFIEVNPEKAGEIVKAVDDAVSLIRKNPDEARLALPNFTDLNENLSSKINLGSSYGSKDLGDVKAKIQDFADLAYEEGYIDRKIDVRNILYQPS